MRKTLIGFLLMTCAFGANAASISLVPLQANTVMTGQTLIFEIVYDFSDQATVFGGGFDILFDNDALSVSGIDAAVFDDAFVHFEPYVGTGIIENWGVGFLFGPMPSTGTFGTVSFEVSPAMGAMTTLTGRVTNSIAGPFLCDAVSLCVVPVDFNTVTLTRVPLPGALVLLICGLSSLTLVYGQQQHPLFRDN